VIIKFGHVEIPANLINSLKENKEIVFAGAGVSMGAPANLPDFVNLTRQILNLDEKEKFDSPITNTKEGAHRCAKERLRNRAGSTSWTCIGSET